MISLIKEDTKGAGSQFTGFIHFCHEKKHCSMQADIVLTKELLVLHLNL